MADPTYVTVVARVVVPITGADRTEAERRALVDIRQRFPMLPWVVEHTEVPW